MGHSRHGDLLELSAPDELERLLRLYGKVSHKTLRISKVFGIEGKKLLHPDDDFDAVKDFNHLYEGTTTTTEKMHLESESSSPTTLGWRVA